MTNKDVCAKLRAAKEAAEAAELPVGGIDALIELAGCNDAAQTSAEDDSGPHTPNPPPPPGIDPDGE